jgi:hypothetical protein
MFSMTPPAPSAVSVAVFAAALGTFNPAAAQEQPTPLPAAPVMTVPIEFHATPDVPVREVAVAMPRRPNTLVPLYVSYATLQALDIHSTIRALDRGAAEANPLMKRVTASPVSLVAVKVATTAGVFYTTERMWKHNRVAAVVFMVGANSAMTWVVQHNYRAVR